MVDETIKYTQSQCIRMIISALASRETSRADLRTSARYTLGVASRLVLGEAAPTQSVCAAWINDVSHSGAGLLTERAFEAGTGVGIDLQPVLDRPFVLQGTVRYCSNILPQTYRLGVSFA